MLEVKYHVPDWNSRFETSESRKCKTLHWIALPSSLDGAEYMELVDRPGGDGLFGAWVALLAVAAKCNQRGVLAKASGKPHTASSLAALTRLPVSTFEKLLPILVELNMLAVTEYEGSSLINQEPATGALLVNQESVSWPAKSPSPVQPVHNTYSTGTEQTGQTDKQIQDKTGTAQVQEQDTQTEHTDITEQSQDAAEVVSADSMDLQELSLAEVEKRWRDCRDRKARQVYQNLYRQKAAEADAQMPPAAEGH